MPALSSLPCRPLFTRAAFVCAWWVVFAAAGRAGPVEEVRNLFTEKFTSVSTALQRGRWDMYVTGYAWHLPWAYDAETRGRLNETTWGGGFGKSVRDDDGDRHSVFLMTFSDSHRSAQFIASYGWQRYWLLNSDWSVGGGYLAFLFSRQDVNRYLPLPAALPCVSLRYRKWEVTGLFVPRVSQDIKGDVLFLFLRVGL